MKTCHQGVHVLSEYLREMFWEQEKRRGKPGYANFGTRKEKLHSNSTEWSGPGADLDFVRIGAKKILTPGFTQVFTLVFTQVPVFTYVLRLGLVGH